MRTAGHPLYVGEAGAVTYNSVYPSQQQYGPRPPGHMGPASVVAQQGARTDEPISAGPGPLKGNAKATMFAAQQQQQQRSAPYPNPHRYMQSRRPQFINGQTPEVNPTNFMAIYMYEFTRLRAWQVRLIARFYWADWSDSDSTAVLPNGLPHTANVSSAIKRVSPGSDSGLMTLLIQYCILYSCMLLPTVLL